MGFQTFMRVELHAKQELGPRDILPEESLHSGDRFRVVAWTTEPVYVYLINIDANDWSSLEFPLGRHQQIPAHDPVVLPGGGAFFKLNHKTGDGEFVLFASRQPMDAQTAGQLRLPWPLWQSDSTRGGNPPVEPPPPPPPPPQERRTARDRDGDWVIDMQQRVLIGQSEASGKIRIPFRFKHLP